MFKLKYGKTFTDLRTIRTYGMKILQRKFLETHIEGRHGSLHIFENNYTVFVHHVYALVVIAVMEKLSLIA